MNNVRYRITKSNDKKQVFGWACVAEDWKQVDGKWELEPLIDYQKDIATPEFMEEMAYKYVNLYREGGEMHERGGIGHCIESMAFTMDKQEALGIPKGIVPVAWWIGFQITDESVWQKIKSGEYKDFSIEGTAVRADVEVDEKKYRIAKSRWLLEKYNPFHDRVGRFASGDGASYANKIKTDSGIISLQGTITTVKESAGIQGFGKGFEEVTYTGDALRVVNFEDFMDMVENFNDNGVIFSTPASSRLISHGNTVIQVKVENKKGQYTGYDADAGKNYGYDELRIGFKTKQEFVDSIENIIVPKGFKKGLYSKTDPENTQENRLKFLEKYGFDERYIKESFMDMQDIFKFNRFHDEGGKFTTGMGSLSANIVMYGGMTADMKFYPPKDGFMVAIDRGYEKAFTYDLKKGSKELSPILENYAKENKKILSKKGKFLGGWVNTDNGQVYLDVSTRVKSRDVAVKMGKRAKQIAIWDVVKGEEIRL